MHGLSFQRNTVAVVQPCGPNFVGSGKRRDAGPEGNESFRVDNRTWPTPRESDRIFSGDVLRRDGGENAAAQVYASAQRIATQRGRQTNAMRVDSFRDRSIHAKNTAAFDLAALAVKDFSNLRSVSNSRNVYRCRTPFQIERLTLSCVGFPTGESR
jgi:hypothetical protein